MEYAWLPEWSAHTVAKPSDQGRDRTEVLQLWSSSHHCWAENKATESGHLPSPSQSSPPFTIPELVVAPEEAVAVSVRLQSALSAALRTEAFLPEQQICPVANPSDRDGDTKVRQLRSGSRYY